MPRKKPRKPPEPELLSVSEVAALRGVTRPAVLGAIREGRLAATRVGFLWVVRRADAEDWTPRAYVRRAPVPSRVRRVAP